MHGAVAHQVVAHVGGSLCRSVKRTDELEALAAERRLRLAKMGLVEGGMVAQQRR